MANLNNNNLKLAIQKNGRLTDDAIDFLRKSGLEFESYKQQLFSICRNYPIEILYVRDDDIPDYVATGTVDLGILGQNILYEEKPKVKELLELEFGFCSFVIAVPKESNIQNLKQLQGKIIATTFPKSTKNFLKMNNINASVIRIKGAVELTPTLGVSQAIADIVSTGSTLTLNDLRPLTTVYKSQATLIANNNLLINGKRLLLQNLLTRFKAVISAKNYKYVIMNAPERILPEVQKIIPGLKSPTVSPLAIKGWISIRAVIKEDVFWETVEKLKSAGAQGIIVLPIEKIII